jgi:hypothetical protein
MEDSGDSDFNCASSTKSSYLEAAHRAIKVTASPAPAVPCEGVSSASRPSSSPRRGGGAVVEPGLGTPTVLQRCPHTRLCVCPCTGASASGIGCRRLAVAIVIVVSQALFLDATFFKRPRLSMPMASHLFKAIGVGAAMPRLTLIASGQCRLRSSISASTVWLGPHRRPVHLPIPLPFLPQ